MTPEQSQPNKTLLSTVGYLFSLKLLARFLIAAGIICFLIAGYYIWERTNPNRLSFKNYSTTYNTSATDNLPVRIIIKDLNIDLPVIPAKVTNNQWETTTQGASYLTTSPVPGEQGNSIIYAHDWENLFGPLYNVQRNMKIKIIYQDKSNKTFLVKGRAIVPDDHTSILEPTNDKRLTLYTCAGFWDTERLVAVAIQEDPNPLLTQSN